MRTRTLVLLVLCTAEIVAANALSEEKPSILSELQQLDRSLVKICEARQDRLEDREWDMWKHRRELLNLLNDQQRDELKRTSPIKEECRSAIEALAKKYIEQRAARPTGKAASQAFQPLRPPDEAAIAAAPARPAPTGPHSPRAARADGSHKKLISMAAADGLHTALLLSRYHPRRSPRENSRRGRQQAGTDHAKG